MAMLIAWQTPNKAFSPRDARFSNRFLVVTPRITIRDRLRVLLPADTENYYDLRDLHPLHLKCPLADATTLTPNSPTFLPRLATPLPRVSHVTRLLLHAGKTVT